MKNVPLFTGAEAIAQLLKIARVRYVFAYPGTSELMFCHAISKTRGLTLINGRGDKESAFMAAGGSLLSPVRSVAILHGARGVTNAAGAIADARRNEIGTVFFVGLPSVASLPFLPPHGETGLIQSIGQFVKKSAEITSSYSAQQFVQTIQELIIKARSLPLGPTLVGIPQNILENRWIPIDVLTSFGDIRVPVPALPDVEEITEILRWKNHPVILVDDPLFKHPLAKKHLVTFAEVVGAPVVQVHYARGPMLFERISPTDNPYFAGSYSPHHPAHRQLMEEADVLITLEDRNIYERVVGQLPSCRKIAITSHPHMTRKNKYLGEEDVLVTGNVVEIMMGIVEVLRNKKNKPRKELKHRCEEIRNQVKTNISVDKKYSFMRNVIAHELASVFKRVKRPILVDDSQMFGGLLFEKYDAFPSNLRVFGDHGGFIGGGISLAAGLACTEGKDTTVFCTLGDQSFTNAIQGLVSVVQEQLPVIYIICNNGKSVSLTKQILSQEKNAFKRSSQFLQNAPIDYSKLARSLGLLTYQLQFNPEASINTSEHLAWRLHAILFRAVKKKKPVLIELHLPSNLEAWEGIWNIKGNEKKT